MRSLKVQQLILQNVQPLFLAQLALAKGISHIYRVSTGPRGGRGEPELVTNPDELHEAIQAIHAGGGYGDVAEDEGGEDGHQTDQDLIIELRTLVRVMNDKLDKVTGQFVTQAEFWPVKVLVFGCTD